jgi:hypothetical protein
MDASELRTSNPIRGYNKPRAPTKLLEAKEAKQAALVPIIVALLRACIPAHACLTLWLETILPGPTYSPS